ncbi:MAG: alpha/beta hydrolase family protein [Pirellulaceae bacterium]
MLKRGSLPVTFFILVGSSLSSVVAAGESTAADEVAVRDALEHQIVSPELVMMEVEHFCDTRVPRMPAVTSLEPWKKHAETLRQDVLQKVVLRGQAAVWHKEETNVEWLETLDGGDGYTIKKLRFEALPDLWIPALLYEPDDLKGKVPAVMNVNGHDGKGKAAPYKQIRCINQAKRGMLALNVEWLGMGQLNAPGFKHYRMNQLDLCGTSGVAPFYLSLKRGLDVLLAHPSADPDRVAVAGLSGGGWQTIFISSLDTRVKLANPVAGYSSYITRAHHHTDLGDSEQTPSDLATVADYAHLTALLAPRAALLTYNIKDNCCFASGHALPPLLEAAKPIYQLYDREDQLRWHINEDPGTHNFELDNRQALYRMFADHFGSDDVSFAVDEIECESEVQTVDALRVSLPEETTDFNKLALSLCRDLPRDAQLPSNRQEIEPWRQEKLRQLRDLVKATSYSVHAEPTEKEEHQRIQTTFWRLRLGDAWTLPAVELSTEDAQATVLVVADEGYKSKAVEIKRLLDEGRRVVALDPFYVGGSKITKRDFLFGLLVACVGQRPLGVQAGQLAAVAHWLQDERELGPVTIMAYGEQLSLSALVAATLEQDAIARIEVADALGSLKEVIERNESVDKKPMLFCFGLLEHFDIKQLVALVAPREVRFLSPSERTREELQDLKAWYKLLGKEFGPT